MVHINASVWTLRDFVEYSPLFRKLPTNIYLMVYFAAFILHKLKEVVYPLLLSYFLLEHFNSTVFYSTTAHY